MVNGLEDRAMSGPANQAEQLCAEENFHESGGKASHPLAIRLFVKPSLDPNYSDASQE